MRNTKTRLQTFNSGHIGEERTPMMPSGCEEKQKQCEKKQVTNQERTPMMPVFPSDKQEEEQKVSNNKNKRQPMMPSKE